MFAVGYYETKKTNNLEPQLAAVNGAYESLKHSYHPGTLNNT